MLEPLGLNLWVGDGETVSFLGSDYPTRMAVVCIENGGIRLWSIAKCKKLNFYGILADHPPPDWEGQIGKCRLVV